MHSKFPFRAGWRDCAHILVGFLILSLLTLPASAMARERGVVTGIQIEKQIFNPDTGQFEDADNAGDLDTPHVLPPSGALYRLVITNTGTVDLENVRVTDSSLWVGEKGGGTLPAGETLTVDANSIPELDVLSRCDGPGSFQNTATVFGDSIEPSQTVSHSDDAWLVCDPTPLITIRKQISVNGVDFFDADAQGDADVPVVDFPSPAFYRLIIQNTGDIALTNVVITDSALWAGEKGGGTLAPDQMVTVDAGAPPLGIPELEVSQRCNSPGFFENIATVTGTYDVDNGLTVSDSNAAWLECVGDPSIDIEKQIYDPNLGTFVDADQATDADVPVVTAPSGALFRLIITNTGNLDLFNVIVNDPVLGVVGAGGGPLLVGQSITVTHAPDQIPQLDSPEFCDREGQFVNVAEVIGRYDPDTTDTVRDEDPAWLICEAPEEICLVIIDEEGLDNDFLTVESAAAAIPGVDPDELINDDRPTEGPNPPLLWNELVNIGIPEVARIVKLPTGQVDDEGWFAPPPPPTVRYKDGSRPDNGGYVSYDAWMSNFAAGLIPQHLLDEVLDVMPMRNQDLVQLIGRTCNAVVYDSDVSINYHPLQANLQGERLGLFTFTVLAVEVPGSLPESKSSTSLYDLWIRVESPMVGGTPFQIPIHDHEPDAIEINLATWGFDVRSRGRGVAGGTLSVQGESDFAPGATMTLSVDGSDAGSDPGVDPFLLEAPMWYCGRGNYCFEMMTPINLDGRRVLISTDEGGSYNSRIR